MNSSSVTYSTVELRIELAREMPDREHQMRFAEPRAAVDEERIVRRARGLPHRSRRGHGEPVGAPYYVILETVARIEIHRQRPPAAAAAGGLLVPALRRRSTSPAIPRSVSKTPVPCSASAANDGTSRKFSASSSSGTLEMSDFGRVLLVVLHHERHGAHIDVVLRQIRVKILHALDVLGELPRLAVGDEHDAVGTVQHQLPRRLVVHLAGDGVELEARREPRDGAEVERQEVEEERAIRLRREGDHLPFAIARHLLVNVMQIRRLPGPPRAVVDDLAGDLTSGVVDQRHGASGEGDGRLAAVRAARCAAEQDGEIAIQILLERGIGDRRLRQGTAAARARAARTTPQSRCVPAQVSFPHRKR